VLNEHNTVFALNQSAVATIDSNSKNGN